MRMCSNAPSQRQLSREGECAAQELKQVPLSVTVSELLRLEANRGGWPLTSAWCWREEGGAECTHGGREELLTCFQYAVLHLAGWESGRS